MKSIIRKVVLLVLFFAYTSVQAEYEFIIVNSPDGNYGGIFLYGANSSGRVSGQLTDPCDGITGQIIDGCLKPFVAQFDPDTGELTAMNFFNVRQPGWLAAFTGMSESRNLVTGFEWERYSNIDLAPTESAILRSKASLRDTKEISNRYATHLNGTAVPTLPPFNLGLAFDINDDREVVAAEVYGAFSWVYNTKEDTYKFIFRSDFPEGYGKVLTSINNGGIAVGCTGSCSSGPTALVWDSRNNQVLYSSRDPTIADPKGWRASCFDGFYGSGAAINNNNEIAYSENGFINGEPAFAIWNITTGEETIYPLPENVLRADGNTPLSGALQINDFADNGIITGSFCDESSSAGYRVRSFIAYPKGLVLPPE